MQGVSSVKILHLESQMKLAVAQIVGAIHVPHPGQLQLEVAFPVGQIHDDKGAVRRGDAPHFRKAQSLLIKGFGTVQIKDVVVFVDHFKLHCEKFLSGMD